MGPACAGATDSGGREAAQRRFEDELADIEPGRGIARQPRSRPEKQDPDQRKYQPA
jgi:hypothetical protein